MADNEPEFSVYWWDRDGGQHRELQFVEPKKAVLAAHRLTNGPASIMDIVRRVMITDGGDCCVFEWTKQDGVIWPKREETAQ